MSAYYLIFSLLALFILISRIRAYLRTRLVGDLVIALGVGIFLLGLPFQDNLIGTLLGASGFITLNIGLIILATIERTKVKNIYASTSIIDRLTGNLPTQYKDKKYVIKVEKGITLKAGVFSIILAIALYLYGNKDISNLVVDGILFFGGIFFLIVAYIFGNKKDDSGT
jgi:hypothetical protein